MIDVWIASVWKGIYKIDVEAPFLQGRAFVFASQFSSFLPQTLVTQYLDAAVSVLESPEVSVPVKISAVKTIKKLVSISQLRAILTDCYVQLLPPCRYRHPPTSNRQGAQSPPATSTSSGARDPLPSPRDHPSYHFDR